MSTSRVGSSATPGSHEKATQSESSAAVEENLQETVEYPTIVGVQNEIGVNRQNDDEGLERGQSTSPVGVSNSNNEVEDRNDGSTTTGGAVEQGTETTSSLNDAVTLRRRN